MSALVRLFRPHSFLAAKQVAGLNRFVAILLCGLTLGLGSLTRADTFNYSPVQATARPYGLAIADQVVVQGSDTRSATFNTNGLPAMNSLIDLRFSEYQAYNPSTAPSGFMTLDPSKLKLSVAADVRVYFVGEGAGYHNSLGVNTTGMGVSSGNPLLVFPDASSPVSFNSPSGTTSRTQSEPLFPGDFVELGNVSAGKNLDFFVIANGANGANGGSDVFSTNVLANADQFSHAVAFAQTNNPYLLIGFEDLYGGGDKDFNDLLFAVDVGRENWASLTGSAGIPAPEPGLIWVAVLASGAVLQRIRRRRPAATSATAV
jgi:hypothetical protein